jgi:ferredoxin
MITTTTGTAGYSTAFSLSVQKSHWSPSRCYSHKNPKTSRFYDSSSNLYASNNEKEISPLFYAAAGAPAVNMDQYNLPLEEAVLEWTAILQPKTSMQDEGIFLQTKTKRGLFVDSLQYKVKRVGGLGLILTEIAGGREDGIGITIVEDIIDNSNAQNSGILPGDSIVAVTLFKTKVDCRDGSTMTVEEEQERIDISTECLSFDSTVKALSSLPPPESPDEYLIVTVKRIRKQPRVNVKLQYPPESKEPDVFIELFAGENLRRAMLTRGVKLNDALARRFDSGGTGDCGAEGTCATCVVKVTKGMELLSPAKQQEAQILSQKPKWRLACKAVVGYGMRQGDLTIQVNPRQWND